MKKLWKFLPIQSGHFFWCRGAYASAEQLIQDCFRCKGNGYLLALTVNVVIAALEFWGSATTHSLSLFGDAWHVVFDGCGNLIGFIAMFQLARVSEDPERVARYRRQFEVIMAFFIIIAATVVLREAVMRLWYGAPDIIGGWRMFTVAAIGLGGNALTLCIFWVLSMRHEHEDTQGGNVAHNHGQKDDILWANILHTLQDTISSLLVILVSIGVLCSSGAWLGYLDMAVSVLLCGLLLWQATRMLNKSTH